MSQSRIKDKIAALRAKTRAAGCTEAEALAAAGLAAELMAKHGLSEADMVMTEASAPEETSRATWRTTLAAVIAICTNTAAISLHSNLERGSVMLFVGRAPGPEIAIYLRDVCTRAVASELKAFKAGTFYRRRRTVATRRQAAADFTIALVARLQRRLFELFGPTLDKLAIEDTREALQFRFKGAVTQRAPERKMRFSEAVAAGWVAAGKIPLNHGVGSERAPTPALPPRRAD